MQKTVSCSITAVLQCHWPRHPQSLSSSRDCEWHRSGWCRLWPDDPRLIRAGRECADWTCWYFSEVKTKQEHTSIKKNTDELAANKSRMVCAHIYQYGCKWHNNSIHQNIPQLNAKPVRIIKHLPKTRSLTWNLWPCTWIYSVSLTAMERLCSVSLLKGKKKHQWWPNTRPETPTQSIFVGYFFWCETKKIDLPVSLLDTSFQLSWRVCVVLSCLVFTRHQGGEPEKNGFLPSSDTNTWIAHMNYWRCRIHISQWSPSDMMADCLNTLTVLYSLSRCGSYSELRWQDF